MGNSNVKKIRKYLLSNVELVEGETAEKGALMFGYLLDGEFNLLSIKSENRYGPSKGYYFIPESDKPERRLFKREISDVIEEGEELPVVVISKKETTKKLKEYGVHEIYR